MDACAPQPQLIACEFPMPGGCPTSWSTEAWAESEVLPEQVVDGLRHVAYTAHRVANGMVTIPEPVSQPSAPAVRATPPRPVTQARATAAALSDARSEIERLAARLLAAEAARDEIRIELAAATQQVRDLTEARDEARAALATVRRELGEQRRRTELAEQRIARDVLTIASLTEQHSAPREEARDQHERAATARAELAAATARIEALRDAATAAVYAEQRLADAHARHEEQLAELRVRHQQQQAEFRGELDRAGDPSGRDDEGSDQR
ncbi:hypothetical protein [Pseudonocardia dioxanivorans]|uniref:hypothetical protein n=1 Tax=Pseudonocardia dioxanivorans TaxID=240495 RepID=UPI000CD2F399|nr:hypothetical protein [Pseudonocardia dioxanivorans]